MSKVIGLILVLSLNLLAQRSDQTDFSSNLFTETRSFDGNNIEFKKITNLGDFNSATWSALNYGTLPAKRILFDAGFWVTGLINDNIHSAIKFYSANYSPGPIINGQPAMISKPEDSLRYRVYKIFKGNNPQNPDLIEWPTDFGAPTNIDGEPIFYGDHFLWSVYNTWDTSAVDTNYVTEKEFGVLPIEIQQKIYGRHGNKKDFENIFHNVVFFEWTIINKGRDEINSAYIGLWADIDFYDINSNLPAVDVNRKTGYLWSGIDFSPSLGGVPPAVGLTMLYGPVIPNNDSTAIFNGRSITGFENLSLNAFHAIGDDTRVDPLYGPPRDEVQVYNAATGLSNAGSIIIDPNTSRQTKFPFNGDPVTETGWLFPEKEAGNGSGFILFTGPFNLAVSDTQWVMAALVPGHGVDKKESIVKMREKIDILKSMPYDSLAFGSEPAVITSIEENNFGVIPKELTLHQNYPNPFNPITNIKFAIPSNETEQLVTLRIYDILGRMIKTLVNKNIQPGEYQVEFDAEGLSSGVYFYKLTYGNYSQTRKMLLVR